MINEGVNYISVAHAPSQYGYSALLIDGALRNDSFVQSAALH